MAVTGDPTATWSWAGLTEQNDYTYENNRVSSALLSNGSAETPRDISATVTEEFAPCAVAASFAPAAAASLPPRRRNPMRLHLAR